MSHASVKAYQHLASLLKDAGQQEPPPAVGGYGAQIPPEDFPTPWASSWGEDEFGFWCGVSIGTIEQRFRWISPGTAHIGSPESESKRFDYEVRYTKPTQGFWFAETTCTQAFWHAVTGGKPSEFEGDSLPVEQVSWEDIQERFIPSLCEQLNGITIRLPTEVEWEYACRAGSETAFWWGNQLTTDLANYDGNFPYDSGREGVYREKSVGVFEFFPNPWGLYQMHGNVWEWCEDHWQENPEKQDRETGQGRVVRGGSWVNVGRNLRSAMRSPGVADGRFNDLGFRLVAGPPEAE